MCPETMPGAAQPPHDPPQAEALDPALVNLGWPELRQNLARLCTTRRGGEAAAALLPSLARAEVDELLELVSEARTLLAAGEPLPFGNTYDLAPALARLQKEGALDGPTLVHLGQTLQSGAHLSRFVRARAAEVPSLARVGRGLHDLHPVYSAILDAFDAGGAVADHASPELKRLRRRVAELHQQLGRRMRALLESPLWTRWLQDHYYTQREDRYVLPVRTDSAGMVEGIVHGASASGATLFIEPREVIEHNNQLKVAELEVAREELQILLGLATLVGEHLEAIAETEKTLVYLDLVAARARLAERLEAARPAISADGSLLLRDLRHPLMLLAGSKVIPNTLELAAGRTLIVTGPNAGGKSVCLKALGLSALMLKAGMHVPAAEGSSLPFYSQLFCQLGDDQSLSANLSTFSAQLTRVLSFVARASADTLVLLDEIATGTDPGEGEALAQALLESLASRATQALVTTHYERLKALPLADPRFVNASVGFDLERMAPTYRLHLGTPGSSFALPVAQRLGLPEAVLTRARSLLDPDANRLSALLAELAGQRESLHQQTESLARETAELQAERVRLERQRREAEERARREVDQAHLKAHQELVRARRDLERVRAQLRQVPPEQPAAAQQLKSLDQQVSAAAQTLLRHEPARVAPPQSEPVRSEALTVGQRVFLPRLGERAEILELPRRGKVAVRVGGLRSLVDLADVHLAPPPAPGPKPLTPRRPAGLVVAETLRPEASTPLADIPSLDVRGMRVDEALAAVDRFVDDVLLAGRDQLRLLHGQGSGALRAALRTHLGTSDAVEEVRAGTRQEGGDGVTLVRLR